MHYNHILNIKRFLQINLGISIFNIIFLKKPKYLLKNHDKFLKLFYFIVFMYAKFILRIKHIYLYI